MAIHAAAWMPTHRSRVELFRFVDSGQLCGISQSHSAGRLSLSSDDDLVTSIIGAVGIPMRAIVAVGCGEVVRQSAVIVGRKKKTASPPEQRAASWFPFHSAQSNGRALRCRAGFIHRCPTSGDRRCASRSPSQDGALQRCTASLLCRLDSREPCDRTRRTLPDRPGSATQRDSVMPWNPQEPQRIPQRPAKPGIRPCSVLDDSCCSRRSGASSCSPSAGCAATSGEQIPLRSA